MFDTSQWPDSECREIAISHSHRNYNRPKTTYGGSVTQVLLSTYKRTDIGGGDAFSLLTQKMRHKWQLIRYTNGSDSVSFTIFYIDVLTVIRNKNTQKLTQKQKKVNFCEFVDKY